jgi:hypothetical protein
MQAGQLVFIPTVRTLLIRFGSWRDVMDSAGLLTGDERARWVHRGGPRYTVDQVLDALARAIEELGQQAGPTAYAHWRRTRLRVDAREQLPSEPTIVRLFGSFSEAKRRAAER